MPDGVIPALTTFVNRRRPAASIREVSAEQLAKQREEAAHDHPDDQPGRRCDRLRRDART